MKNAPGPLPLLSLAAVLAFSHSSASLAAVGRWTSQGPWGGIVRAIAIDPQNPQRIAAGSEKGVFLSENGGNWWTPAASNPTSLILSLTMDPQAPTTLYAGTQYDGVFKTTDGGATWIREGLGTVNRLVVDPQTPGIVWAATDAGMFKSVDGGGSWEPTAPQSGGGRALALDPGDPRTVYVGSEADGGAGLILKTVDGGITWSALSVPSIGAVWSIAVDPSDPGRVYAGTAGFGFFRTTDGGLTWSESDLLEPSAAVTDIVVDPAGVVRVLTYVDLVESTDHGLTFRSVRPPLEPPYYTLYSFALDPNGSYYVSREDGIYKSFDHGTTWNESNDGLNVTSILSLAVDPLQPGGIYAGSLDVPWVFRSVDGGLHWTRGSKSVPIGSVYSLAADPVHSGVVYAGTPQGLWKTVDSGVEWTMLPLPAPPLPQSFAFSRSTAIDPHSTSRVLVGMASISCHVCFQLSGLWESRDGGDHWRQLEGGLPEYASFLALKFAPDGQHVFAGTDRGVFRSADDGTNWVATSLQVGITAVKVDPEDPSVVYAASLTDGIFRSDDGGATWISVTSGLTSLQVRALELDPSRTGALYAGTADGVFESHDRGQTWTTFGEGLGDRSVLSLVLDSNRTLHAGTASRGVFEFTIPVERRLAPAAAKRPPARFLAPRP